VNLSPDFHLSLGSKKEALKCEKSFRKEENNFQEKL
jgi:hypothetical protein